MSFFKFPKGRSPMCLKSLFRKPFGEKFVMRRLTQDSAFLIREWILIDHKMFNLGSLQCPVFST